MSAVRAPARFHGDPPRGLTSALLEEAGLPHLFTTRHFPGAASPWQASAPFDDEARRLLRGHGLDGPGVAFARQVHGAAVARPAGPGLAGIADALVSDRPALPVAVFTADCVPVLIWDPLGRRVAAVHAGWRGTARGVTQATGAVLAQAGGRAGDFVVGMGPSIGPCCYEVDAPVIDALSAAFPGRWEAWVTPRSPGKWTLDLWQANEDQLVAGGVSRSHIDNPRLCTACRPDLFFSHRRGGGRGRLAAVAAVPA